MIRSKPYVVCLFRAGQRQINPIHLILSGMAEEPWGKGHGRGAKRARLRIGFCHKRDKVVRSHIGLQFSVFYFFSDI